MRKTVIVLALASSAIASPAMAREGGTYIEIDAGVLMVEDADYDIVTTSNAATLESEYGYDFGGTIGYDFGMFRLEAEASFREADPDVLTTNGTIGIPTGSAAPLGFGSFDGVAGDSNALSGMINGLLDFGHDDGLQFYVGGGAGIARVTLDSTVNANGPGFLDDEDTGFAWQAIAGVRAPISQMVDFGVKYRFFNVEDIDLVDGAGRDVHTRWRSHSLMGTLNLNFGGV
jgi:OmpA-OmpF porin, OOP family